MGLLGQPPPGGPMPLVVKLIFGAEAILILAALWMIWRWRP